MINAFSIAVLIASVTSIALVEVFVWKVADGDTIWVSDENGKKATIRMNKIDAPENFPHKRRYCVLLLFP